MTKLYDLIAWHNNTNPALNEDNLNAMSQALDEIDDRVAKLADDVLVVVPEIRQKLSEAEEILEEAKEVAQNVEQSVEEASGYAASASRSAANASASATTATAAKEAAQSAATAAAESQSAAAASAQSAAQSAESAEESADAAAGWSAHPPYVGENGNWYIYDTETETFVDSGFPSRGDAGTIATTTVPGIVKPDGETITVDADGTIHGGGGAGLSVVDGEICVTYVA